MSKPCAIGVGVQQASILVPVRVLYSAQQEAPAPSTVPYRTRPGASTTVLYEYSYESCTRTTFRLVLVCVPILWYSSLTCNAIKYFQTLYCTEYSTVLVLVRVRVIAQAHRAPPSIASTSPASTGPSSPACQLNGLAVGFELCWPR